MPREVDDLGCGPVPRTMRSRAFDRGNDVLEERRGRNGKGKSQGRHVNEKYLLSRVVFKRDRLLGSQILNTGIFGHERSPDWPIRQLLRFATLLKLIKRLTSVNNRPSSKTAAVRRDPVNTVFVRKWAELLPSAPCVWKATRGTCPNASGRSPVALA
jgi:hypothetical protein